MENREIIIGEDVLQHHGVKGMRWGVRRTPKQLGHDTSSKIAKKRVKKESGRKKVKELEKKQKEQATVTKKTASQTPKKRTVKDMSDAELQSAINRMQLEQRYNQLNPEKVSKGKQFVNSTLNKVVIPAVQEGTKQILRDAIVDAGKSYMNKNNKKK